MAASAAAAFTFGGHGAAAVPPAASRRREEGWKGRGLFHSVSVGGLRFLTANLGLRGDGGAGGSGMGVTTWVGWW